MDFDKELDVRGLNCPLPILRSKKYLADMASGQILRILATDPGSAIDFQVFFAHPRVKKPYLFYNWIKSINLGLMSIKI